MMSIYVKDPATDRAVRRLAKLRGVTLTEAIRMATEEALARSMPRKKDNFLAKVRELQDELAKYPRTGLKADKDFFDDLSGGL
jgi:antitoxin VapB